MTVEAPFTIVLVPSLGTTSRLFDDLSGELSRLIPEATVTRVDLPGHGSGPDADVVSVQALADDLVTYAVAARSKRTVIVGVSMGGAIALEAARRHPQTVDGFVQINSGVVFGSAEGWDAAVESVTRGGTGGLSESSEAGWFAEEFRDSQVARALLADLDGLDDATYIACCRALATYDGRHDLAAVSAPALLIGTGDDRGTPAATMRDVAAQLPQARFAELLTGGHLSVAEYPGEVADLIAEWAAKDRDRG